MQAVQSPIGGAPLSQASPRKPKPTTLASIAIQSFAAFRSQASQASQQPAPVAVKSPLRRKPLPANSPIITNHPATQSTSLARQVTTEHSPFPPLGQPTPNPLFSPDASEAELFLPRDLDNNPHGSTPLTPTPPQNIFPARKSSLPSQVYPQSGQSTPRRDRSASNVQPRRLSRIDKLKNLGSKGLHARSPTMPTMTLNASDPRPPDLKLRIDSVRQTSVDDNGPQQKPKSPGGFSFFGWNSSKTSNEVESPATNFSDRSFSPAASPRNMAAAPPKSKPNGLDIPAANALASYFNVPGTPLLSLSPQMNAHVEELERELRQLSAELASSIHREMELEDEVERLKLDAPTGTFDNRRTSDYFSDSGTSSIRFPIGDPESKLEELESLRRKAEQERAQLKVTMAERLQEELRRRRDLEEQVHQLEEKATEQTRSGSMSLDDIKRRLAEERQVKENLEDLLTALRGELEKYRNEADNLRDEVVPQLRARLEVMEAEAADAKRLVYETARMQQEVERLRNEKQQVRFESIAEESSGPLPRGFKVGLTRSNSLSRNSASFNSKRGSLLRSKSVREASGDSSPSEGLAPSNPQKELEEQRDALHKALRLLLQRQDLQQRDYQRRIKELENERDTALNLTPRRTAFHREVTDLRLEVNSLRRRADDALEQKWQCEKGLGGLRMDLDRAQQETGSLRDLLREHDITVPEIRIENQPASLDKAYHELRTTHALSLARVRQLESSDADSLDAAGTEAAKTLDLLKRSISDAEAERDYAQKEAKQYRNQARALQRSELDHLGKEQKLSSDLLAAATRMDELSNKIEQQLAANSSLRKRLTEAISRGEQEQRKSTEQIIELERRLQSAEDHVMAAQQSSEDAVSKHEDEAQAVREGQRSNLRRITSGLLSPAAFSPKQPSSPMFAQRSPRLAMTTSGPAMSFTKASQTESLEKQVGELEKALRDADREMEEVVGRMNTAQIEVAELQFQRDEAMKQTRKLQKEILTEREKVQVLMNAP